VTEKHRVYLDYAATTPVDPEVQQVISQYNLQEYGNASSLHEYGLKARQAIETARHSLANFLNISSDGVIFTGSGTEADNMALQGIMYKQKENKPHLITDIIEHPAVYNTAKFLEDQGFEITILPVTPEGFVDPSELEAAIQSNTTLISIHYINNEIGTIQPIKKIGAIAKNHNILFHSDAVQAFGKIPINMQQDNIDFLSLSGHKIYCCKGIGALCLNQRKFPVKKNTPLKTYLQPLIYGGSQENGMRPATENVSGIAGLEKAIELAQSSMKNEALRIGQLRDYFIDHILEEIPDSALNGARENRLFNNVNIRFTGINGYDLLLLLDNHGIAVSTGSACSSRSQEPSRILMALGLTEAEANSSVRFTLGKFTTQDDLDYVLEHLSNGVHRLRSL
jgi:cysteine desulfurase